MYLREVVPPLAHVYPTLPVNYQHFGYWKAHSRSFSSMAALRGTSATLSGVGTPELLDGVEASAGLFTVLGVRPAAGSLFAPDDDSSPRHIVVITEDLWQRRFNRDPGILRRAISLDGISRTVAGILSLSFHFPAQNDLGQLAGLGKRIDFFVPLRDPWPGWEGDYDFAVFARLRAGTPLSRAMAEIDLMEKQITTQYKVTAGLRGSGAPLQETISGPIRTGLTVLLGAVLLLLLIVCVNIANLQLARSSARTREFAIRAALGATQWRLAQQVLVESIALATAGGLLGIAGASMAIRIFAASALVHIPRIDELRIDLPVLLFSIALTVVCGAISGLVPAVRLGHADPQQDLKTASQAIAGHREQLRLRDWLVGAEVAISVVLLMLAGLLTGSLWKLLHVDRGFTVDNAVAVRFLPATRFKDAAEGNRFIERALDTVRAIPGVVSAGFIAGLPLTGETMVNGVDLEGTDQDAIDPATHKAILVNVRFISSDYFRSIGIPLVKGRTIERADRDRKVTVISERLAAKLWPNRDPLGRTLNTGSRVGKVEVIGIVRDVHNARLDLDPTLIIYVPPTLRENLSGDIVIRTALRLSTLMPEVQRRLWSVDRNMPIPPARTIAQIVSEVTAQRRLQMQIACWFALSALILAALGIYGVTAFNVTRRRKEIGIRLAIGAQAGEVRRLMVATGLRPVIAGLLTGLGAAIAFGRLIGSLLYQVSPANPVIIAAVAVGLFAIAFIACSVPAHAASALDPIRVLRDE